MAAGNSYRSDRQQASEPSTPRSLKSCGASSATTQEAQNPAPKGVETTSSFGMAEAMPFHQTLVLARLQVVPFQSSPQALKRGWFRPGWHEWNSCSSRTWFESAFFRGLSSRALFTRSRGFYEPLTAFTNVWRLASRNARPTLALYTDVVRRS